MQDLEATSKLQTRTWQNGQMGRIRRKGYDEHRSVQWEKIYLPLGLTTIGQTTKQLSWSHGTLLCVMNLSNHILHVISGPACSWVLCRNNFSADVSSPRKLNSITSRGARVPKMSSRFLKITLFQCLKKSLAVCASSSLCALAAKSSTSFRCC